MNALAERAERVAMEAARAAGAIIMRARRRPLRFEKKGGNPRDVVTDADKAADAAIRRIITSAFPEHGIVSEESEPCRKVYTWYVDPIDGTTNFLRGRTEFCVSIALAKEDTLLAAAIYAPASGQLYHAAKGKGAYCNGKRLAVSDVHVLHQAIVGLDYSYTERQHRATLALARKLIGIRTVRVMGSAALALAMVASGQQEAYFHTSAHPWDFAAGVLLIREAGGTVTAKNGLPFRLQQAHDILAANRRMHRTLLRRVT